MIYAAIVTLLILNLVLGRAQRGWYNLNGANLHFNLGYEETLVISLCIYYRWLFIRWLFPSFPQLYVFVSETKENIVPGKSAKRLCG